MDPSNEDTESEGHGAGAIAIAIALICLPIFYVLSIGPVILLYEKNMLPASTMGAVGVFYTPLNWLDRHMPGRPISKYARLWY